MAIFRNVILVLVSALAFAASAAVDGELLHRARVITGYAQGDALEWEPMAVEDRTYIGPTAYGPGYWFRLKEGRPGVVHSLEDLKRVVYDMAYTLQKSTTVKAGVGVLPRDIRDWVRRINTSIYGQISVSHADGAYQLTATHSPEARMLAAFRNPDMEKRLQGREKDALNTCAWWICSNIKRNMPNGLKLQRIHDALIDTTEFDAEQHNPAEMLLDGQGSSLAYATSLQLLLHMMKIDARIVRGTEEMNHVWNFVQVNEEWYHLDMCWNDPDADPPLRLYNYYLLTDAEMAADHQWGGSDVLDETPQVNLWHKYMHNEMRRCWRPDCDGYELPRSKKKLPDNTDGSVSKTPATMLRDQIKRVTGVDVTDPHKMKDKVYNKAKRRYELHSDRDNLTREEAEERTGLNRLRKKYNINIGNKSKKYSLEDGVSNVDEFNIALKKHAEKLDGARLTIRMNPKLKPWQMREIVCKSDLHLFARRYNIIYNDLLHIVSLDIVYWEHIRLVYAHRHEDAAARLSAREKQMLDFYSKHAKRLAGKDRRKTIDAIQQYVISRCCCNTKNLLATPLNTYTSKMQPDKGTMCCPGAAEAMYVMLNVLDIPCKMVQGRDKVRERSWLLVHLNVRDWYHCDPYSEFFADSDDKEKYRISTDVDMAQDHVWDGEEHPQTPTKAENEAIKNIE